jgi:hypothetical protein
LKRICICAVPPPFCSKLDLARPRSTTWRPLRPLAEYRKRPRTAIALIDPSIALFDRLAAPTQRVCDTSLTSNM